MFVVVNDYQFAWRINRFKFVKEKSCIKGNAHCTDLFYWVSTLGRLLFKYYYVIFSLFYLSYFWAVRTACFIPNNSLS